MNLPGRPFGSTPGRFFRPVAIIIMVAGVVTFFVTRLVFGEQVWCLFGSTLLTFAGLGLILAGRRFGGQPGAPSTGQMPMDEAHAQAWLEQLAERQSPENLLERALAHFEAQGARVTLIASRPGRAIVQISGPGPRSATALLLETRSPVDVAELRALIALMNEHGSRTGYLVACGGFTRRAMQWTQGKPLELVGDGSVEQILF